MARTPAQTAALVKKATAETNKSNGMRTLLDAGMEVKEVAEAFSAPYGFVYGVATRNGNVTPTPRAPKAASTAKATKAPARATAKATTAKAAPRAAAKAPAKAATKSKAKAKA